jgi:hypothetical protein
VNGSQETVGFLTRKWAKEDYRLIKELLAFRENWIAVRFAYEWHDDSGNWFRSYGNENWEFDENGSMARRPASINPVFDLPIRESDRKYHWPLGRRPDQHPDLSELGLLRSLEGQAKTRLHQISAVRSALDALGVELLTSHLQTCVLGWDKVCIL